LWVELFARAEGYLKRQFRCESERERCYQVFDIWRNHWNYQAFREQYAQECERLDRLIAGEGLIEKELLLGTFYMDEDGPGEDNGLTLR